MANRKRPVALEGLLAGRGSPVAWGAETLISADTLSAINAVYPGGKPSKQRDAAAVQLGFALVDSATEISPESVLAAIALAHALPSLAAEGEAETWWDLLERLLAIASDAAERKVDPEVSPEQAWAAQLVAGELPFTLGYQFPELVPCRALRDDGRKCLTAGPLELLDGEGMPSAAQLLVARPLLACWTRCASLGGQLKRSCFSEDARVQYEWLIRQTIRLTRHDGSQLLTPKSQSTWTPDLIAAALREGGDAEDCAAAMSLPGKLGDDEDLPPGPAVESEWASLAVLRSDWRRSAPRLGINYAEPDLQLELEVGGQTILWGTWSAAIWIGGQILQPESEWEQTCWFSDDDVDYLEVSLDLTGGARLDRQILLARKDLFLILTDVVIGDGRRGIRYEARLPIAEGTTFTAMKETREGMLRSDRPAIKLLPLALPEWRVDARIGELQGKDGQLVLTQESDARNVCCPLFFDLKSGRTKKECTWRQLTVAESLQKVAADVAVGYRVQSGKQQWILYRSLDPPANRTVLGHNLSSEFYLGRFDTSGKMDELIEIEP